MGLFTSRADLEAKIATLETENGEMASEIERLEGELTNATADRDAARKVAADAPDADAVATLTKERDEAKAEATAEKIEAKAIALLNSAESSEAVQKIIASRVTEELAKAGQPEAVNNAEHQASSVKTITRAEFNALGHSERDAHIKAGGKITD